MIFDNQGIKIYDVSKYQTVMSENGKPLPPEKQKHIDFNVMKTKASAVIIKCGQWNYKDPAFEISWRNAKLAGIPRGSYWFCDRWDTGRNQARLYWSYIKNDVGEGILSADFESGSWNDLNQLYNFIYELQQLSSLPNEKIVLYTNYYYFMEAIQNAKREWFAQYPLWIASYSLTPSSVKIPPVWEKTFLWQYGTPVEGKEAGVQSLEIDGNYLNGGYDEFKKYFGESQNIPEPEEPKVQLINKHLIFDYKNKKIKYSWL
jgi:GH25 family lysozyme M1 (1,4-beta-N-acetylmuramidase)